MNYLAINIRGADGLDKANWVNKRVRDHRVSFLCLQETQKSDLGETGVRRFWGNRPAGNVCVNALGRSGGLLSVWNPSELLVNNIIKHDSVIVVSGRHVASGITLNVANVYAFNDQSKKRDIWRVLLELRNNLNGAWIFIGDLNEVWDIDDRLYSRFDHKGASVFNDFINQAGLNEYPMGGCRFTFMPEDGSSLSKIDRALVCDVFMENWPYASWLDKEGLGGIVLKSVMANSSNTDCFTGKIQEQKISRETNREAKELENIAVVRPFCKEEKVKRANCRLQIKRYEKNKVADLIQKVANNRINSFEIDGVVRMDPTLIKKKIMPFFKKQFAEKCAKRLYISNAEFKKLSDSQSARLVTRFSAEEVKRAVWDCGGDKAPGPDGFTFRFIKRFWHILEPFFVNMLDQFFQYHSIPPGCNSSFISLI
ncbi:uncharacterized protein LOC110894988 [Helianthus annuus]|uniref:uncharacterized protein LOC110894988 n=1 Tax=Helianthus annuus TaxID=4232 RepID=UPI000B90994A|nr:uncharacterized protein LOC110894988 [Helianthus annuus]